MLRGLKLVLQIRVPVSAADELLRWYTHGGMRMVDSSPGREI